MKWVLSNRRLLALRWVEQSFIQSRKINSIWRERCIFTWRKMFKRRRKSRWSFEQRRNQIDEFEKECNPFLEYFLLKIVSRIISLFWWASFLDAEMLVGAGMMFDSSFQEFVNFKKSRWCCVSLKHRKEEDALKEWSQEVKNKFSWQKEIYFHNVCLDQITSFA